MATNAEDGGSAMQVEQKKTGRSRKSVYLWEFLLALLADDDTKECIHWIAKEQRIFEIKDVDEVAKLWGMMKEKPAMNKETFLRSLRYYYTSVLRKVPEYANAYQFLGQLCPCLMDHSKH